MLTKLTDGKTDASKELTRAAREMRDAFDQKDLKELAEPLKLVKAAAGDMGVPVGAAVQASSMPARSPSRAGPSHSMTRKGCRSAPLASVRRAC